MRPVRASQEILWPIGCAGMWSARAPTTAREGACAPRERISRLYYFWKCSRGRIQESARVQHRPQRSHRRGGVGLSARRKKEEQPALLCGNRRNIRRNRISFVPPFYGFLRLFTANGKKLRADGEVGGPREESSGPGTKPAIPLRQWSFIVKKFARG